MSDDSEPGSDGEGADGGDRDPFDSFDEHRDHEGDPFDSLDGDAPAGEPDDSDGPDERAADDAEGRAQDADRDPFEYRDGRDQDEADPDDGGTDRSPDPARADAGDPLADVETPDGDPFESNASAFERSGVEGIDPDEVWTRLTDSGDAESESDTESDSEPEADATAGARASETPPPGGEDDVAVVSKHAYCEGCEYFSPPPDVTCSHEGTEILEFVDVDSVRVANCPIVEERRELEDGA